MTALPNMLAKGFTSVAWPTPQDLFAGEVGKIVTDQAQAGGVDIPALVPIGFNAAGLLVAMPSGFATQTYTIAAGNAVADETVTIGGTAITWKAAGAAGSQVNIGADATASAVALKTYINAHPALGVTATNAGGVVTLTAIQRGLPGNAITLAEAGTNTSVGGATLTGGDLDAVPEAKPCGVSAQPIAAGTFGPFYVQAIFNHEALTWPTGIDTLAERKAVFAGTPIGVRRLP